MLQNIVTQAQPTGDIFTKLFEKTLKMIKMTTLLDYLRLLAQALTANLLFFI
jgi:hypothetical protein